MKKLGITKEQFEESAELKSQYGNLAYVNESGSLYKTDKGRILKFVKEAREYVNDDSIEPDTTDEFIIFDDPEIFNKIANLQKKEEKKVQEEIKDDDVSKQEVAQAASKGPGLGTQVASSAITGATNIVTNPTVISLAATAYAANKAADTVTNLIDDYKDAKKAQANSELLAKSLAASNERMLKDYGIDMKLVNQGQDYVNSLSDAQLEKLGFNKIPDEGYMGNMEYHKLVAQGLPEKDRADYLKNAEKVCDRLASSAVGAGAAAAGGAAATGAGASASGAGGAASTTIFGLSLATIGWIAAGVAAAAVITPYIYDKVRACTKTWMADIIAEVKFKADGKNYRCFYDLKKNKWVLTYDDIKWTSYLDNKLDKETKQEFFASDFFKQFLDKCRRTFAMLFSTGRNEIVFKTLPEIKDAPKELKKILEKIYDNKGAISKNMFAGKYED